MNVDFVRGLRAASNYLRHTAVHSDNDAALYRASIEESACEDVQSVGLQVKESLGPALNLLADEVDNLCEQDFAEDVFHEVPLEGNFLHAIVHLAVTPVDVGFTLPVFPR